MNDIDLFCHYFLLRNIFIQYKIPLIGKQVRTFL